MASALQSLSLLVEVQNRAQEAPFPEEFARVISRDCFMAVINKCRSKETPRGVESAPLTPGGLARRLVSLLDGTRDRAALVEGLLPLIDSGEATVKVDNQPVMDRTAARFPMEEQLEEALTNIARIPLLIG